LPETANITRSYTTARDTIQFGRCERHAWWWLGSFSARRANKSSGFISAAKTYG